MDATTGPAAARLSSELLGYPPDARLLILNCDDFGMYPAINTAVIESIEEGVASSCSLFPPTPAGRTASLGQARLDEIELEFREPVMFKCCATCRPGSANGRCIPVWETKTPGPSMMAGQYAARTSSS